MSDDPQLPQLLPPLPAPILAEEDARDWRPGHEHPAWTIWDAATIFAVFLLSVMFLGAVALGIASHLLHRPLTELARNPKVIVPAQLVAYVVTVIFAYLLISTRVGSFLPAVRWNFPRGLVLWYLGAGVVLSLLVQATSGLLPIPKSLPIEHFFSSATDAWIMSVFGCTVAPFVEELLFRGILYPALARRLGMVAAIGITASGFALLHTEQLAFAWAPLMMLLLVGVVLTLVRARTGSVAASFLVHAAYNFTIFVLLWFGTDHFRHMDRLGS